MRKNPEHYVDNKEFLRYMIEFREITKYYEDNNQTTTKIQDEIVIKLQKIESHLSLKSNFILSHKNI